MELWDIYDENKKITGRTMIRNDWNMKEDEFHLTVLGIIKRTDGKYLITKRREDKGWGAGWWEVPGGGVNAGESSSDAIIREIKEDTGLDVSNDNGKLVLTYKRINPEEKNNYFVDVYKFIYDFDEKDITIQKNEASEFKLASLKEMEEYANKGIFLHYDSIKDAF